MVLIVVHGGAGTVKEEDINDLINGVISAARKGFELLKDNQTAVDAVVAAVTVLEDNFKFNAGLGSCLTIAKTVENDAIVMDGKDLKVGSVACVSRFKNPVQVAHAIMLKSDHCILTGKGAHLFGEKQGFELIDNKELVHQNALDSLEKYKTFRQTINKTIMNEKKTDFIQSKNFNNIKSEINLTNNLLKRNIFEISVPALGDHDTVGAVALDKFNNLACATSTGGLTGKALGRIGDSPLAGSGAWADNDCCAISTTGHGEKILRANLSKHIAMELAYEKNPNSMDLCVEKGLEFMKNRLNGFGGVICLDQKREFCAKFTTPCMPWAAIDSEKNKLYYGIFKDQIEQKDLI